MFYEGNKYGYDFISMTNFEMRLMAGMIKKGV